VQTCALPICRHRRGHRPGDAAPGAAGRHRRPRPAARQASLTLPENFICRPYRGVSVQHWDGPLGEAAVKDVLLDREAYRRTEFVVLRGAGGGTALVRLTCSS